MFHHVSMVKLDLSEQLPFNYSCCNHQFEKHPVHASILILLHHQLNFNQVLAIYSTDKDRIRCLTVALSSSDHKFVGHTLIPVLSKDSSMLDGLKYASTEMEEA
ncbi:hypothetical protein M8C21_025103, partial [Ambrosia artemisiifolia]